MISTCSNILSRASILLLIVLYRKAAIAFHAYLWNSRHQYAARPPASHDLLANWAFWYCCVLLCASGRHNIYWMEHPHLHTYLSTSTIIVYKHCYRRLGWEKFVFVEANWKGWRVAVILIIRGKGRSYHTGGYKEWRRNKYLNIQKYNLFDGVNCWFHCLNFRDYSQGRGRDLSIGPGVWSICAQAAQTALASPQWMVSQITFPHQLLHCVATVWSDVGIISSFS